MRRTPRNRLHRALRPFYRLTLLIFLGGIAVRLIFAMLDTLAARAGGNYGGEILIPIYIVAMPIIGWKMRGWWQEDIKPILTSTNTPQITD